MNSDPVAAQAELLQQIDDELSRGAARYPDPSGLLAALVEEVGELSKALIAEPRDRVQAEAIQVAALAIRIATQGDPTLAGLRLKYGADLELPPSGPTIGPSAQQIQAGVWRNQPVTIWRSEKITGHGRYTYFGPDNRAWVYQHLTDGVVDESPTVSVTAEDWPIDRARQLLAALSDAIDLAQYWDSETVRRH